MRQPILVLTAVLAGFAGGIAIFSPEKTDAHLQSRAASFVDEVNGGIGKAGELFSIAAHAGEPGPDDLSIDFDSLLRIGEQNFDVSVDRNIVGNVLGTTRVRKVGYGRTNYVNIVTTSSGAYSSDGVASPNVQYYGIEKGPLHQRIPMQLFMIVQNGFSLGSLINLPAGAGGSFVYYGRTSNGGTYKTSRSGTCFSGPGYAGCS